VCTTAPLDAKLALLTWLVQQKVRCAPERRLTRHLTLAGRWLGLAVEVNLEAGDHSDCTPLHCAAALGDSALVKALLKAGALPGGRDAEGLTALHLAVRSPARVARLHLRSMSHACHVAQANGGHAAVCAALTANWAPVDAADWEEGLPDTGADTSASARVAAPGASLYIARRGTPLHVSCAAGRPSCAAVLIQAGADVNSRAGPHSCTPLHIAAREGHVPLALALLDAGARVNEQDGGGETALMRAAEGGHSAMVRIAWATAWPCAR
jgi:ankyrin repeat protein